jgi:hypothetical protein
LASASSGPLCRVYTGAPRFASLLNASPAYLAAPIQPGKANSMFDTLMLLAGVAAFALFLGYSALCMNL